jgi:hypothetical protein
MLRTIVILLAAFLLGMHLAVIAHEIGHALGILLGGGHVDKIIMLTPLPAGHVRGSTNVPWLEVWGGVLFGTLATALPLTVAYGARHRPLVRLHALMTAVFCLGHNGTYLFVGGLVPFSDARGMVDLGAPRRLLVAAGLPLLAGLVMALREGLRPLRGALSRGRFTVAVEAGLLSVPAMMLLFMGSTVDPSTRAGVVGLVVTYGLCFALAAWTCHTKAADPSDDPQRNLKPPGCDGAG